MSEPEQPPADNIRQQIGCLASDVREMASLRWELAQLELKAAAGSIKSLAVAAVVALITALCALPILTVALALWLDGCLGISLLGWLLIFGLILLIGGIASGTLAWRRFRRRFVGLEQTLEELREDAVWLKEWAGRNDREPKTPDEPDES